MEKGAALEPRFAAALPLAWTGVVLLSAGATWGDWGSLLAGLIRNRPSCPGPADLAYALQRHSLTFLILAALAASSWAAGGRLAAFLNQGRLGKFERGCVRVLFGWAASGFVLLGLAMAGLFFAQVVVAALMTVSLAGFRRGNSSGAGGEIWPKRNTLAVFFAAGAPGLLMMLASIPPDAFYDTYSNHLAAPAHFLGLHSLATWNQHYTFNYQVLSELLNAVAIITGRDELAHFISLVPFLAGLGLAAAWLSRQYGPNTAALASGLSLDLGGLWWVMLRGKNDTAVAGFCIAALVSMVSRRRMLAAACWGLALATKLNAYMLLAPVVLLVLYGNWRKKRGISVPWSILLVAAIPPLPGLVRSWLDHGSPVWPLASWLIRGTPWEPDVSGGLAQYNLGPAYLAQSAADFLPGWFADNRVLMWALPLALLGFRRMSAEVRALAAICVFSYLFMAGIVHMEYARYTLPLLVLFCFVSAPTVGELVFSGRTWSRWLAAGALAVLAFSPVATAMKTAGVTPRDVAGYLLGTTRYPEYLHALLTTRMVAQARLGEEKGVRGVMLVDEIYAYRWPGRAVTDMMPGRAMPWVLTKYAGSVERVYARVKQLGISHVAFNFISEGHPYNAELFPWDKRQLALWRDFVRAHMEIINANLPCDVPNGGFYLYRIVGSASGRKGPLFYLPGIKNLRFYIRTPFIRFNDSYGSADRALAESREFPDVLVFRHEAGLFYAFAGDWKKAYGQLKECVSRGMVGEAGYIYLGKSAMMLGKYDEAAGYLKKADGIYVDQHGEISDLLARTFAGKAQALARKGFFRDALACAESAVGFKSDNAFALVSLADLYYRKGEAAKAGDCYSRALSLKTIAGPLREHALIALEECRRIRADRKDSPSR